MHSLPTAIEINPNPEDLDGQWAEKNFLGKSLEDVEIMLRDNAFCHREAYMCMGGKAFKFYFKAALSFVQSDHSKEESDFVSSMIGVLEHRLFDEYNDFDNLKSNIRDYESFCECIFNDFTKYELDSTIYGDMKKRVENLLQKLT